MSLQIGELKEKFSSTLLTPPDGDNFVATDGAVLAATKGIVIVTSNAASFEVCRRSLDFTVNLAEILRDVNHIELIP